MDTKSGSSQQLFDLWKRQIDETTQAWAGMLGAPSPPSMTDPTQFWRPFMDSTMAGWAKVMSQGPVSPDLMGQWKQFLDYWIDAWSKALSQAMGTDAFAKSLGQYLDQWLSIQGPLKKTAEQSVEPLLQAAGLPSRAQVTGVARQLVELEERLERLEDGIAAVRRRLEAGSEHDRKDGRRAKRRGQS